MARRPDYRMRYTALKVISVTRIGLRTLLTEDRAQMVLRKKFNGEETFSTGVQPPIVTTLSSRSLFVVMNT